MARRDKLLRRMRRRTRGVRYDQVANLLQDFGFVCNTERTSHRVFKHPSGVRAQLVDQGSGSLKPVYVKNAIQAIDEVQALAEEMEAE